MENKERQKAAIILSTFVLLFILAGAVAFYNQKQTLPESKKASNIEDQIESDSTTVTDNDSKASDQTTEEKQVHIKSVEEIENNKNQKYHNSTGNTGKDEKASANKNQDKKQQADRADKENGTGNQASSEENINIIDESPDTIKEKNVHEYQGGEKQGNGFQFHGVEPEGKDVNGDIKAGGKQDVGTWN